MSNLIERVLPFGARNPLITIIALTIITIILGFGVPHLKLDLSNDNLIAEGDPTRPDYDRITAEFGSDNINIVLISDPDLWTVEKLGILDEMHYAFDDLPLVQKVDSLYTARSIRDQDGMLASDTILLDPPWPGDEDLIEIARENALYSPLLRNNLISDDGQTTALIVTLVPPDGLEGFDTRAYEQLSAALEPFEDQFETVFQLGNPRVNAALEESLIADLSVLAPAAGAILMLTIGLFLRSGFAAWIPLVSAILAIVWTLGFMGHTGIAMNVLSAMLPVLIMVIGSTEDTHMIAVYFSHLRDKLPGEPTKKDIRRNASIVMAKHVGVPVVLTTFTTLLGFAANSTSAVGMIRDFAYASSFGILANGLITIFFVPLILAAIGPTTTSLIDENDKELKGVQKILLSGLEYLRRKRSMAVAIVTVILCAIGLQQALGLKVSNDPMSFFREDNPLRVEAEQLSELLAGSNTFYITLESDVPDAFRSGEALQKILDVQAFLRANPKIDITLSLADQLSLVHREFNGGQESFNRPPDDALLIDQYMLFFQRRDVEGYISHDFQRANILVRHSINDSSELNALVDELDAHVASVVDGEFEYFIVGRNLMVNAAAERLIVAQIQSIGLLIAVIFIMMSLLFTNWRGGVISLIPNAVPIIFMFGIMGIFNIPLNPATVVVAVIAIGIAIDDTIHLMTKFNEESRKTWDREAAVEATVRYEAIPVISTSISLCLGFAVLLLSDFSIIAQFGLLAGATMLFAMVADLLITPIAMGKVRLASVADILALQIDMDVVRKSPLFEGMSDYEIRKAILLCQTSDYESGDHIITQGDVGQDIFMVLEGQANVTVNTAEGTENKVAEIPPGGIIGEIGFTAQVERTANVVAEGNVSMLVFNAEGLRRSLKSYPRLASQMYLNISKILGGRLAATLA